MLGVEKFRKWKVRKYTPTHVYLTSVSTEIIVMQCAYLPHTIGKYDIKYY